MKVVISMAYFIALILFVLGCIQIFLTGKSLYKIKATPQKRIPKFIQFSIWYGSLFGLLFIFVGFDIIFKWI